MRERDAWLDKQNEMRGGMTMTSSFGKSKTKNNDLSDYDDEEDDILNQIQLNLQYVDIDLAKKLDTSSFGDDCANPKVYKLNLDKFRSKK